MITIEEARSLRAKSVEISRINAEAVCYAVLACGLDAEHSHLLRFAQQAGYIKALDEVLK